MAAVLARGDAHGSLEAAVEGLDGAEAAFPGDRRQPAVGRLEQAAGGFNARSLDIHRGCHTEVVAEAAGEVPRAHARASGEGVDRQVAAEVVSDEGLRLADRMSLGGLGLELHAELRLP